MPGINEECYYDREQDVYDLIREYTDASEEEVKSLVNTIRNSQDKDFYELDNVAGYTKVKWCHNFMRGMIDIILRWEDK